MRPTVQCSSAVVTQRLVFVGRRREDDGPDLCYQSPGLL